MSASLQHSVDIREVIARSGSGQQRFFDSADFSWTRAIEARWPGLREEVGRLLVAVDRLPGFEDIQHEQRQLSTDKRWKIFPLHVYGHHFARNSERCPQLAASLREIPHLRAAMLSILQAGKVLHPHEGPYNGVLRYHLGLVVPEPEQCGITVGGETRRWEEGASLIFDDSHTHQAWNNGTRDRVVLFVDFDRPLPSALARRNEIEIARISRSSFIMDAIDEWHRWEAAYGAELDRRLSGAGESDNAEADAQ
ncbi:aspartyl/asparaginyl beta-hydroxylase domain-containing protein [Caballeronia sp. dw_276]|uniref:aspartyl/asparaginyl beta-hydroxylase domain-containing protein n=1 Tax=Caballeronia sp. dw_276 TaxID=2719795 RepID=UPI001BD47CA4|nr:aspartyl/asparaginyl beta-hydroxylase domain-containing protein [Caballeronia sp. dw_276]